MVSTKKVDSKSCFCLLQYTKFSVTHQDIIFKICILCSLSGFKIALSNFIRLYLNLPNLEKKEPKNKIYIYIYVVPDSWVDYI